MASKTVYSMMALLLLAAAASGAQGRFLPAGGLEAESVPGGRELLQNDFFGQLKQLAENATSSVTKPVGDAFNQVKSGVDYAYQTVKNGTENTVGSIKNASESVTNPIKGAGESMKGTLENATRASSSASAVVSLPGVALGVLFIQLLLA